MIGYGASYAVLSLWALGRQLAVRAAVIGWMLALYVAVVVALGGAHVDVATYALVVAAVLVGWPWSMAVCGSIVLGAIGLGAVIGSPVDQRALGLLVSVAVGSSLCAGAAGLFLAVREARAEIARLAVVQERERVYRDLHDVLGHHLTAITVKAGLARRLLDAVGGRLDAGPRPGGGFRLRAEGPGRAGTP